MKKMTAITGATLLLLGLSFFAYTAFSKYTALIPAYLGVLFLLLAWLAKWEKCYRCAMHLSSALAFLGALPLFMGLSKLYPWIFYAKTPGRPLAAIEMTLMGLVCCIYFAWCLRTFLQARMAGK